jgi:hypothetical protein
MPLGEKEKKNKLPAGKKNCRLKKKLPAEK